MAGEIYYPNITGAFDWGTLLDGLMKLESYRLQKLQAQEQILDSKIKALNDLKAELQDLYDFAASLNPKDWFNKKVLENLNPEVVDAKIINNDIPEYTVQGTVNKIAQIEIDYFSRTFESTDEVLNPDNPDKTYVLHLTYRLTDDTVISKDIEFQGKNTLQELIDKINNDPDIGPYIRAYAMYTGEGYRFALMEKDVEASKVESDAGGPYNSGDLEEVLGDFYVMQGAKNSEIQIGNDTFEDPGYDFVGLFPGLKVTVKKTGDFTLKVKTDYEGIAKVFVDLVNKINDAIRTINKLTAIKKDGDNVEGPTISEYSLKELKIRLQRLVEPLLTDEKLAKYNIVDYNPDDGTITISESKLRKFLEENPKENWEVLYKVAEEAKDLSNLATSEAYVASLLRGYSSQKRRLEERIMEYQEYLKQKEEFLKKRFARIETYISSLQNMQAKINQILIAQMVLTNKK